MQRSMLGYTTLVIVVVVAAITLASGSSFSETIQCRTGPGAPALPGMHWYYRADRTNNRHCWYMLAAGLPVRSHGMPSNLTVHVDREGVSAPLQTDPMELSQIEAAETNSTDTVTSSIDEATTNFTARWSDLAKSVDLDQQKSSTDDNYVSEPMASDSTKPVASTASLAVDPKRGPPHRFASAVYFWSIFLAGVLSTLLFGCVLKLTRWLYSSAARSRRTQDDYTETNPSELVRALRRVDEFFNTPRSFSPSVAVTDVLSDQGLLTLGVGDWGSQSAQQRTDRAPFSLNSAQPREFIVSALDQKQTSEGV